MCVEITAITICGASSVIPAGALDDVLPYFRKAEDQQGDEDAYHGVDGPLTVADAPEPHPLCDAFIAAGVEQGYPRNPDFNGASLEGFGYLQFNLKRGRRASTATAYLRPARRRRNLHVVTPRTCNARALRWPVRHGD